MGYKLHKNWLPKFRMTKGRAFGPHHIKRDLSDFLAKLSYVAIAHMAHETCIFCDYFDTSFMTIAHCIDEI